MIDNINKIRLSDGPNPIERRIEMSKDILKDSTFTPETVELKDIDESFVNWVENDLKVLFEDKEIPTMTLFSNQRFSEYEQAWADVDENLNMQMNFKIITRENNPKIGNIYGKLSNVPTNEKYVMKSFVSTNKNGNKSIIEYKMAQPMAIDVTYKMSLITNKYELLNKFNVMVNGKFKSIQAYIAPNGHYMSMKLTDISDESEYSSDDRIFYSQTYTITVMGYLISEDDYEIEEKPIVKVSLGSNDGVRTKPIVEIEEKDGNNIDLIATFDGSSRFSSEFTMDCDADIQRIEKENIRSFSIRVNGINALFKNDEITAVHKGDLISLKINKIRPDRLSKIIFHAVDKNAQQK